MGCVSRAGAWAYVEGQVAAQGSRDFSALSRSLAQALLVLGLRSRRDDAIRDYISCFLLARGLLTQGLGAPELLPPGITAQHCGRAPGGQPGCGNGEG